MRLLREYKTRSDTLNEDAIIHVRTQIKDKHLITNQIMIMFKPDGLLSVDNYLEYDVKSSNILSKDNNTSSFIFRYCE